MPAAGLKVVGQKAPEEGKKISTRERVGGKGADLPSAETQIIAIKIEEGQVHAHDTEVQKILGAQNAAIPMRCFSCGQNMECDRKVQLKRRPPFGNSRPGHRRRRLVDGHRDFFRLLFLGIRNQDGKNAVFERGLYLIRRNSAVQ
jgi:hypothetical protein